MGHQQVSASSKLACLLPYCFEKAHCRTDFNAQWEWAYPNSGAIKNIATKRCAATGKEIYQGRYLQTWFCDDVNQHWDFVPIDQ